MLLRRQELSEPISEIVITINPFDIDAACLYFLTEPALVYIHMPEGSLQLGRLFLEKSNSLKVVALDSWFFVDVEGDLCKESEPFYKDLGSDTES